MAAAGGDMESLTYRSAGVDLERNEEAMRRLPTLLERTFTPRVLPVADAFAGLFRLNKSNNPARPSYDDPVLVSGTDGVGTKVKVAQLVGRFDTVGIDLVAMSVNDVLCMAAEPLFFLDYLAMGRDNPDLTAGLVKGVSDACMECGAALLGGETAIMPDVYHGDDFDMAGFCVGVAERNQILDGGDVRPRDVLIGIASSGFHSNGYSLVRKIVFEKAGLTVDQVVPELQRTVGEALLEPTRLYPRIVMDVLRGHPPRVAVSGLAHITGGGLRDNIARFLPENCRVQIDRRAWPTPPLFQWLQELGPVDREEMYRVFNMGIGFVLIARPTAADAIRRHLADANVQAWMIGEVVEGPRGVTYVA